MNKLLYVAAASVAMMVLAPSGQAQSVNYNGSKSNSGNVTAAPSALAAPCPGGVSRNAAGACPPVDAVNKTTTRSNTQHN